MSVIEKLKAESLRIRRDRGQMAAFSVFVLSEIAAIGKKAGNRETTEDEAIQVLKKTIGVLDANLAVVTDPNNIMVFNTQKKLLQGVLPKLASDDDVRIFLNSEFGPGSKPSKGDAMKALKAKFGSLVDMKRAGEIYTEMFA